VPSDSGLQIIGLNESRGHTCRAFFLRSSSPSCRPTNPFNTIFHLPSSAFPPRYTHAPRCSATKSKDLAEPLSEDEGVANVQSPTRRKQDEHWTTVAVGVEVERSVQLKMTSRRAVMKDDSCGADVGGIEVEDGAGA
jgi:hypothetical protein